MTQNGKEHFFISANEWIEKNGTNSSFKVKGVKIPKSLGVKNIAKIPSGLHNPLHYKSRTHKINIKYEKPKQNRYLLLLRLPVDNFNNLLSVNR